MAYTLHYESTVNLIVNDCNEMTVRVFALPEWKT